MPKYGLLGKSLGHSFSKGFFTNKFEELGLSDHVYQNFELEEIDLLQVMLTENPDLQGFNVTIPYKEVIIPKLAGLDPIAREIGAVNVVKREAEDFWWGYNTDVIGMAKALTPYLKFIDPSVDALVLGTGGASKAACYVLKHLALSDNHQGMGFKLVSRKRAPNTLSYEDLGQIDWSAPRLIINTTPLGMYPDIEQMPQVPIERLGPQHIVFDLIYNPESTVLLQRARQQGSHTLNGLVMLIEQAEAAWAIWQNRHQFHGR